MTAKPYPAVIPLGSKRGHGRRLGAEFRGTKKNFADQIFE